MSAGPTSRGARGRTAMSAPFPELLQNACTGDCDARMRQADAGLAQAEAMNRLAAAAESAIETFRPAADAIHSLGMAQQKLCAFLVGNRLKIAASIPTVLIAVGGLSPNAAKIISNILQAIGAR
jgi:hypothetical protein